MIKIIKKGEARWLATMRHVFGGGGAARSMLSRFGGGWQNSITSSSLADSVRISTLQATAVRPASRCFASRGRAGFEDARKQALALYPDGQRKHKVPQKRWVHGQLPFLDSCFVTSRASALLAKIKEQHLAIPVRRKELPEFKVGDSVEVTVSHGDGNVIKYHLLIRVRRCCLVRAGKRGSALVALSLENITKA